MIKYILIYQFYNSIIDNEVLLKLLELPILVVLDEAYIEFSAIESKMSWVKKHENLIILRTFSKRAGMIILFFFSPVIAGNCKMNWGFMLYIYIQSCFSSIFPTWHIHAFYLRTWYFSCYGTEPCGFRLNVTQTEYLGVSFIYQDFERRCMEHKLWSEEWMGHMMLF